jgi:hypothetical protein
MTTVLWNVDPKDYRSRTADEVWEWFATRAFRGGDVVLFHDTHPHAAGVLPGLVAAARERAIAFTTIPAWTT